MIKIKLARHGAKNSPSYRIVAIESGRKRGGAPLEILGFWHPAKDDKKIDKERLKFWLEKGAKKTDGVRKLLSK